MKIPGLIKSCISLFAKKKEFTIEDRINYKKILPDEIIRLIFQFLPFQDQFKASRSCYQFYHIGKPTIKVFKETHQEVCKYIGENFYKSECGSYKTVYKKEQRFYINFNYQQNENKFEIQLNIVPKMAHSSKKEILKTELNETTVLFIDNIRQISDDVSIKEKSEIVSLITSNDIKYELKKLCESIVRTVNKDKRRKESFFKLSLNM
jgi:hypothetical protein